jgi:Arc/MetJ-type ribon-helix-helix transcriptional regulator
MQENIMGARPGNTITLSFSLPKPMVEMIESTCSSENRTKSELMREALRMYFKQATANAVTESSLPLNRLGRKSYTKDQLAAAAQQYATDPDYADIRAEGLLWERATVADGVKEF